MHGKTGASSPEEEICIDNFFKMLEKDQYKIQNRVMLARYRGKTICPNAMHAPAPRSPDM